MLSFGDSNVQWCVLEVSGTGRGRPARRSKLTAAKRGRSLFFLITWSPSSWLSISPSWNSSPSAGYQCVYSSVYRLSFTHSWFVYLSCISLIWIPLVISSPWEMPCSFRAAVNAPLCALSVYRLSELHSKLLHEGHPPYGAFHRPV